MSKFPFRLLLPALVLLQISGLVACGGRTPISAVTGADDDAAIGGEGDSDGGQNNTGKLSDGGFAPDGGTNDGGGQTIANLVGIDVTPALNTVPAGTRIVLVATARYSNGTTADLSASVSWMSSDATVATVAGGRVECLKAGNAIITASTSNVSGTASVTVTSAKLTGVLINPVGPRVAAGNTLQLSAIALFDDNSKLDVTTTGVWSAADNTIATVSAAGVASGTKAGTTTITLVYQGQMATIELIVTGASVVSIEISPINATLPENIKMQFRAVGVYNDNSRADLTTQVGWTSSATNVVVIESATGSASTVGAGAAVVTARLGSISAATSVTVVAAQLTAVEVLPATAVIPLRGRQQFSAIGKFSDGSTHDVTTTVAWSGDDTIASVSNAAGSQGLASGLTAGKTTITASLLSLSGSATLTVTAAQLSGLAIAPTSLKLPAGTQAQLRAIATYSDATTSDVTQQTTWGVGDGRIGAVSNTGASAGLVSALRPGTTQITVSFNGLSATAILQVTDALLQSITVAPATLSVALGRTGNFKATGNYSDGSNIDLTALVTWFIDDAPMASISNLIGTEGQVTGKSKGDTSVHATLNGISGTAELTITGPVVENLAIMPINPTAHAGQTVQLSAVANYSDASTQNVTTTATWTTGGAAIATVDELGLVTCQRAGQTAITAEYLTFKASVTVVCTAPVIVRLQVSPFLVTIYVGQQQNFSARLIYSDGSSQTVTNQSTWTSDSTAVATISNQGNRGVARAIAVGTANISASYMGFTDTTPLTVTMRTLTGISVSPVSANLHVGQNQQFQASAIYSDGSTVNVTQQTTWTTSNPAAVDVLTNGFNRGRATALAIGSSTISASYMGFTDRAIVNVTAPVLTSIAVSPVSAVLHIGQTQNFQVTAIFDDGSTIGVTNQAVFSSTNSNVADVVTAGNNRGRATGLQVGTADIVASYMGFTDKAIVTVDAGKLIGLSVTPANNSFPAGTIQSPMTATALYDDNTTAIVTAFVAWVSNNPAVADVTDGNNRGLLTTFKEGSATITVTWMSISGSTLVTVTP